MSSRNGLPIRWMQFITFIVMINLLQEHGLNYCVRIKKGVVYLG